ncbi:MAG: aspartate dehydrogenase [Lachnospiraceae bacterium]|nr:aspartate dehydrogenase [Lachnospiraceae bacterium]
MFGIGKAGRVKETSPVAYDPEQQKPVLRCSICTGEQVAGFQDIHSGKFEEVMLIRDQADLQHFKKLYGVEEITKIY